LKILNGRHNSEDLGVDGRTILKMDLKEVGCEDGDDDSFG
jgi:hypothetical protein